ARVKWGDGSADDSNTTVAANNSGGFDVSGSHTYGHEGSYPVQIFIQDAHDKSSDSGGSTATVADAPLGASGTSASATRGLPFGGTVATFTDADASAAAGAFTAAIDWGDQTSSAGAVAAADGGGFRVTGSHTYATTGSQAVSVTIHDSGGASVSAGSTIDVGPAAFVVSTNSPETGKHVKFDAFKLGSQHGGAKDYRWDLNGDGIYERDTHGVPALAATFGLPGSYQVGVRVLYADHSTFTGEQALEVSGAPVAGCGVYCGVDFPFHGGSESGGGAACESSVRFGVVDAIGDCIRHTGAVYVADGTVRINGIDLIPVDPEAHITLDPGAGSVSSAGDEVTVQLGELVLGTQAIDWTGLDAEGGGARASLPALPGAGTFEGFPFVGSAATTLTHVISRDPANPVDHGVATIGAYIQLPDFIGGIGVAVGLSTDNDNGLALDQLHVHLSDARLEFLPIKQLDIDFDASASRWGGGLQVDVGAYELGASLGLRPVDPSNPAGDLTLDYMSAAIDSLNVSIYAGVFLQRIEAGFTLGPPENIFQGGATFSYGPKVAGIDLIDVSGVFTLTTPVPAGGPLDFNLAGELDVISFQVGTAQADVRTDGNFSLDALIRVPYWEDGSPTPNPRIQADMSGFIDGPHGTWDVEGTADACLGPCVGVTALASNIALAGCVNLGIGDAGAAYNWNDRRVVGFGGLGGTCDLGPWRPTRSLARASLSPQGLVLPAGMHLAAFQVTGQDAPPEVTFSGPRGVTVTTPVDALGAKTAHTWLYKDPVANTTNLAVSGDLGGTWTITPQPGSSAVKSITESYARPPVSVKARVGGRGRKRTLAYSLKPQPGQKVRFAELGRNVRRIIGSARGTHGTLRFAPADGRAGRRRV
ncbi:MAG: hypothetical protein QOH89_2198, partial [Pseudonocardiales bacterium]|nr:hypothetical protein [Pseudonocardiales bacterium]